MNNESVPHEKRKLPASEDRSGPFAGEEDQRLVRSDALGRLLRPVRTQLFVCALLSAIGAAAGFAPYIAVAEIARVLLPPRLPLQPPPCGLGSASGWAVRACAW